MVLDRFLHFKYQNWNKTYFNGLKVIVFGIGVSFFFGIINIFLTLKAKYEITNDNDKQIIICNPDTNSEFIAISSWVSLGIFF